jgi:glucose/arabinose dehydrogenase
MDQVREIRGLNCDLGLKTESIMHNRCIQSLFRVLIRPSQIQCLLCVLLIVFSALVTFISINGKMTTAKIYAMGQPDDPRRYAGLGLGPLPFPPPGGIPSAPSIKLQLIASGLNKPLAVVSPKDGSGRLFIVQQGGKILVYDGTEVLATPFLDISSLVSCCGERGLLGLAFHPDFEDNGFFYVDYTDINGDTVVARYSVSAQANVANVGSALTILTALQPFSNHNGGHLEFGPDGFLYISMGDGGGGSDPNNNAQNLGTVLGKILRVDVDSDDFPNNPDRNYAIPLDNPFVGQGGARGEIWVYGLRNPWSFSFDRLTNDLFIGDVGENTIEEIDFQSSFSSGGENYGWRCYEGNNAHRLQGCGSIGNYDFPILNYSHSLGCSVTGGYRYRGVQVEDLVGYYLYADFCSGRIWGATPNLGSAWTTTQLLDTTLFISGFGEDESGELYVADLAGSIYRIVDQNSAQTCTCNGQVYTCGAGAVICGTNADNLLDGTPGNDVMCGFGGNDTIHALGADDIICGGDGNDSIWSNKGNDVILGEAGDDYLDGGFGNDTIKGGFGNDTLIGWNEDDMLDGGIGTDNLNGGFGNDTLIGWNEDDMLDGGPGFDQLIAGDGIDTCRNGENNSSCER